MDLVEGRVEGVDVVSAEVVEVVERLDTAMVLDEVEDVVFTTSAAFVILK